MRAHLKEKEEKKKKRKQNFHVMQVGIIYYGKSQNESLSASKGNRMSTSSAQLCTYESLDGSDQGKHRDNQENDGKGPKHHPLWCP